ncbi:hypothetical protein N0V82_006035 [Gnomoniopsis sp. IMI 355080]|nr:hypothetical protein N0V82_006035 [Gnomoniopsis sp. IMI 355080]
MQNIYLPGAIVNSLTAFEVHNYSFINTVGSFAGNVAKNYTDLDFCNVTVTYSHEDQDDIIHVNVWLPLSSDDWNGRFQGTGGGGFATGEGSQFLAPALGQGYSAAETDGGHAEDAVFGRPGYWALDQDGQVNEQLLLDFAYLSLNDMTLLGKAVTETYYGKAPHHSYWHGCSTGGRQGLEMAQRYPDAYDGILALSPAINWVRFIMAEYWGQLIMNHLDYYPPPCEFEAITAAAIKACDDLDGVVDGIISLPELCKFDAETLVGSVFACEGTELEISSQAAVVANAVWTGPRNSTTGKLEWYGLNKDASLIVGAAGFPGLVDTNCSEPTDAGTCEGAPFAVSSDWIQYFVLKDPDYPLTNLSYLDYDAAVEKSIHEYSDIINTADADLSAFREAGGKMITTHGLADSLVFPNGSINYYDRVLHHDAAAQDFYRLFLLPGVAHCFAGGPGPYPVDQLEALTKWVEKGDAPDTLTTSFSLRLEGGEGERPACMYPAVQTYVGGDPLKASSFVCQ